MSITLNMKLSKNDLNALSAEVDLVQVPIIEERRAGKVCTISFERPFNYLCDAWHAFSPK